MYTQCNRLQHTATYCDTLQPAMTFQNYYLSLSATCLKRKLISLRRSAVAAVCCIVLQHSAVCCNVLQCAAVCCSVLQTVAEWWQCVAMPADLSLSATCPRRRLISLRRSAVAAAATVACCNW